MGRKLPQCNWRVEKSGVFLLAHDQGLTFCQLSINFLTIFYGVKNNIGAM